jgi:hypothetical protein
MHEGHGGRRRRNAASRVHNTPLYDRLTELGVWSRLDILLRIGPSGRSGEFICPDSDAIVDDLMGTGRFCIDTRAGRILHPATYSLRELSNRESLHLSFQGRLVTAHLDRISPLVGSDSDKDRCRYSISRIAAHITGRLGSRLVRGLQGGWIELDVECAQVRDQASSGESGVSR